MNHVGAGTLDGVMAAALAADVAALLQDTDTAVDVVISTAAEGSTMDPATGITTTATTQTTTTGWLSDLTWRQVADSGGTLQVGDLSLLVPVASLPTAPEVGASVRAGDVRYAVIAADTDPLSLRHRLMVRRTT